MVSALQTAYAAMHSGPTSSWILDDASGGTIVAAVGSNGTYPSNAAAYRHAALMSGTSLAVEFDFGQYGKVTQQLTGAAGFSVCWVSQFAVAVGSSNPYLWSGALAPNIQGIVAVANAFFGTANKWSTGDYNGSWNHVANSSGNADSTAHFWCLVRDVSGGFLTLYMDGSAIATFTGTVAAAYASSGDIYLAARWDATNVAHLWMSDFAIWNNTVFSSGDVTTLYNAASGAASVNARATQVVRDVIVATPNIVTRGANGWS